MRFPSNTLVAGLAAAGALAAGILLAPPTSSAQDDVRYLLSQDNQNVKDVTITGTALNPDGTPAVKLPVTITMTAKSGVQGTQGPGGGGDMPPPPEALQNKGGLESPDKVIGKTVTDDSGRFTVKIKTLPKGKGNPVITVSIGDPLKTPWYDAPVEVKKNEIDMGNVQLKEKVSKRS